MKYQPGVTLGDKNLNILKTNFPRIKKNHYPLSSQKKHRFKYIFYKPTRNLIQEMREQTLTCHSSLRYKGGKNDTLFFKMIQESYCSLKCRFITAFNFHDDQHLSFCHSPQIMQGMKRNFNPDALINHYRLTES